MRRRGFIQLGTAIFGALTLQRYVEPFVEIVNMKDWITDHGDFLVVRVPAFKTFSNEILPKPTLFFMQERSTVRNVEVLGFANISAPAGAVVESSRFDCSKMTVARNRAIIEVSKSTNMLFRDCQLISNSITKNAGMNYTV